MVFSLPKTKRLLKGLLENFSFKEEISNSVLDLLFEQSDITTVSAKTACPKAMERVEKTNSFRYSFILKK
jgi:hypothetical protein